MIKYLNNFSNVNTRNDNISISAQTIENIISCTRPKSNIARCPLSVRLLVAVWHHLETVCWVLRPQATRVQCSGRSPATNTNAAALLTAVGILRRWLFSLLSPDRSQIKKGWARKTVYKNQLEVDLCVSCGGNVKFDTKDKKGTNINPKKPSPSACSWPSHTSRRGQSQQAQMGMVKGAGTGDTGKGHGSTKFKRKFQRIVCVLLHLKQERVPVQLPSPHPRGAFALFCNLFCANSYWPLNDVRT